MADLSSDKRRSPNDFDTVRIEGMASAEVVLSQNLTKGYVTGSFIGGHYEVLKVVGRGGMSIVYKTRHVLIDQIRAVKVLLPSLEQEEQCLFRFQQEATAAARLKHKNIVQVFEFASPADGAPYLVMEYVEGMSLGKEIENQKRLPLNRIQRIFPQLLDALEHTHSQGVIHRDLKPSNIVLIDEKDGKDFIKLIDFGIAKITAADRDAPQGLTPTGEIFGSPQYMSPEQAAGQFMDERSEIYSLGCLLYEMLCGRPPLMGKTVLDTLRMQATIEPTPISKLMPDLRDAAKYDRILKKCLAKEPDHRYQSVRELRRDFQGIDRGALTAWFDARIVAALVAFGTVAIATGYLLGTTQTASGISTMMDSVKKNEPRSQEPALPQVGENRNLNLDDKLSISHLLDAKLAQADAKIDLGDYAAARRSFKEVLAAVDLPDNRSFFVFQIERARAGLATINIIETAQSRVLGESPLLVSGSSEQNPSSLKQNLLDFTDSLRSGLDADKLANLVNLAQYALDRTDVSDVMPMLLAGANCTAQDKQNKLPERDKVKLSLQLATAFAGQGDLHKALATIKDLNPTGSACQADVKVVKGLFFLHDGDYNDARTNFQEAENSYRQEFGQSDENTLVAKTYRLLCQCGLGRQKEAEPAIRQALAELTILEAGGHRGAKVTLMRAYLLCLLAGEKPTVFGVEADKTVKKAIQDNEGQFDQNQSTMLALSELRYPVKPPCYRAFAIALALGNKIKSANLAGKLVSLAESPAEKLRLAKSALALSKELSEGGFKYSDKVVKAYTTLAALQLDERNREIYNPAAANEELLKAQRLVQELAKDGFYKHDQALVCLSLAEAELALNNSKEARAALEQAQKALKESINYMEARADKSGRTSFYHYQMSERIQTQSKIDQLARRLDAHS